GPNSSVIRLYAHIGLMAVPLNPPERENDFVWEGSVRPKASHSLQFSDDMMATCRFVVGGKPDPAVAYSAPPLPADLKVISGERVPVLAVGRENERPWRPPVVFTNRDGV